MISKTVRNYMNKTGTVPCLVSELCYQYDSAGNLLSVSDVMKSPAVTLQSNAYDDYMRLSTHTDNQDKGITSYTYNWESMPISIITKEGNTALFEEKYAYEYNTQGLKTTKTIVGDNISKSIVSSVQQDLIGRTIYEDNSSRADKMFTRYTYDNMNNVTKKEIGSGGAVKLTYQYVYNHAGAVLTETLQNRQNAAYTYDMLGNMLTSADAKGNVTEYTYSGDGLLLKEITPIDSATKGEVIYSYDNVGNLIKERTKVSANGYRDVTYTYDGYNNLIKTRQSNNIVDYTYDSRGNVLTMTVGDEDDDSFARTTTYHYDSMGRCTSLTDPMGYIESYTYDSNGDMTKKTDKNGTVISYTYDGMHRVTTTSATKNGKKQTINNTYGSTGNIVSQSDGVSSKTYKYNDLGLIEEDATKVADKTYTIKKTYDYMGNVSSVNYGYYGVKYDYDVQGRLISVNDWNLSTGASTKLEEYQYDNNNNVVKKIEHTGLPNVEYTYNAANLLSTLKQGDILSYKYTYNHSGNISNIDDYVNKLHTRYSYSMRNQLVSEILRNTETNQNIKNISYEYDAAGNRVYINNNGYESDYIYDKNNRLVTERKDNKGTADDEVISYQYDKNGNRTGISGAATTFSVYPTAATAYTYDAFNRLTQISDGSNIYKYDYYANGLRMSKDVNGTKTYFQWDGDQIWGLSANTGNRLTHHYYRGLNGNIKDNYGATYIYNAHGDVVKVANSSGNITRNYDYDAFGVINGENGNDTNPWRYCGEYYDTETENVYLRARYYDVSLGAFITEDPVRDGVNWYSYCGGNPVFFKDRTGLKPSELEAAAMAEHIYYYNEMSEYDKRIVKIDGKNTSWRLIDVRYGSDNMTMGIYVKTDISHDWRHPLEYAVVNKGTTPTNLDEWKNNFQQPFGSSKDMEDSIKNAQEFVSLYSGYEITFIGHSKGGAEAAANAVATNRNAMLFNPATVNLSAYNLDSSTYTADMTVYVVTGDMLNSCEGWFSEPIGKLVYLPQQYGGYLYDLFLPPMPSIKVTQGILNHPLSSVMEALKEAGYE